MENIHTYSLEDEMARWPSTPTFHAAKGSKPSELFLQEERIHPALMPSPVNETIYNKAILPTDLRPSANTPSVIPASFPRFPPKYTYSFTPAYPPRPVESEAIHEKAVEERELVEDNLAKLVGVEEHYELSSEASKAIREGRQKREDVWWQTWRDMGCDLDRGGNQIWPVAKLSRGLGESI